MNKLFLAHKEPNFTSPNELSAPIPQSKKPTFGIFTLFLYKSTSPNEINCL